MIELIHINNMAITSSFARPVATSTLTKNLSITAAVSEVGNAFHIDINLTVTPDVGEPVVKTLCRKIIPVQIVGTTAVLKTSSYVFPGDATTYNTGGVTPALSLGVLGENIELNSFLTAASDAPEDPA